VACGLGTYYGWDGAFGTIVAVDPREQRIAVLMRQRYRQEIYRHFENAVLQSIIDSRPVQGSAADDK
jgi:CubicO group peptidase (beta-lactamase class C family)